MLFVFLFLIRQKSNEAFSCGKCMKWNKKKFAIKRAEASLLVSAGREQILQNSVGSDGRNHLCGCLLFGRLRRGHAVRAWQRLSRCLGMNWEYREATPCILMCLVPMPPWEGFLQSAKLHSVNFGLMPFSFPIPAVC